MGSEQAAHVAAVGSEQGDHVAVLGSEQAVHVAAVGSEQGSEHVAAVGSEQAAHAGQGGQDSGLGGVGGIAGAAKAAPTPVLCGRGGGQGGCLSRAPCGAGPCRCMEHLLLPQVRAYMICMMCTSNRCVLA